MKIMYFLLPILAFIFVSCYLLKKESVMQEKLVNPNQEWVENNLNKMSLDQKIGQMFIVSAVPVTYNENEEQYQNVLEMVRRYYIGGLVFKGGDPYQRLSFFNHLQSVALIPLFITADLESGVGQCLSGGTEFTSMMGVAATGDVQHAYEIGRITASEARSLGINLVFAPVADVNTNSENPIINIRSFGDTPNLVSQFVSAFIRGIQDHGVLATAKHFPGHGSSNIDRHHELPQINYDLNQLQSNALPPFIAAIKSDVAMIMAGHLAYPALEIDRDEIRPASLSPYFLTTLLRQKMQFNGLIITDSFSMSAIEDNYYGPDAIVKSIQSGADLVLMPRNLPAAFYSIRRAVQNQSISMQRIDESVRKILTWKSKLGLHQNVWTDPVMVKQKLQTPQNKLAARNISRQSITLLKNKNLPLHPEQNPKILSLGFCPDSSCLLPQKFFLDNLKSNLQEIRAFGADRQISREEINKILSLVREADYVINSYHVGVRQNGDKNLFTEYQNELIESVLKQNKPVINIVFGPPYLVLKYHAMENILLIYKDDSVNETVAAEAVCGQIPIGGKLPVSLGNIASRGEGETLINSSSQLRIVDYHSGLPHPEYLDSLKQFLQQSIADSAFPGCAIAVGHKGNLLLQEGFGHHIYDPRSREVNSKSIFDLASLTKVMVTTNVAMILFDRGLLKLDWKVSEIIPAFKGPDKEKVTVRHLLTHSSGLPAWKKFYLNIKGKENIVQAICETGLEYQPGTEYVYSDLGMILMQTIIESIVQKPLDLYFTENISIPLSLARTFYNPESHLINEILPTEISDWHKRLTHGFVHDENAYAMGGVSGHAGLFSCVEDLAVICQLYLNGGIYTNHRIFKTRTVNLFTQRQNLVEGSTRALGWDTRSGQGGSAGDYMSLSAFGHTGFTGTSVWIDPEYKVFVVLLTNRVYPTRNNEKIYKVRPTVHNYVMKAVRDN